MNIAPYCTYYEGKTLVANHICPKRPEFTNVMGYRPIWSDSLTWQVEQAEEVEEDIVYIVTGIRFCPFCGDKLSEEVQYGRIKASEHPRKEASEEGGR